MFITYFKKIVANKEETEFLPWSGDQECILKKEKSQ